MDEGWLVLEAFPCTGLLSNQGEKSVNFYFIMAPLKTKVLKYGTPKPSILTSTAFIIKECCFNKSPQPDKLSSHTTTSGFRGF